MSSSQIYLSIALFSLLFLPFIKFTPFACNVANIFKADASSLTYKAVPKDLAEDFVYEFANRELDGHARAILIDQPDTNFTVDGALYWGAGTERVRKRVEQLSTESPTFSQILSQLKDSEYPYYIVENQLQEASGEFSSLKGELRFNLVAMEGFLFDATIIEEFVHAYQAVHYDYAHGRQRRAAYLNARKKGWIFDRKRLNGSIKSWERYGSSHAFIESEAKIITYLIQNEAISVSLQDIVDTDDYNSGGKARSIISPYLCHRNCKSCRRTKKLGVLDDFYLEQKVFMHYQRKFIQHWNKYDPNCKYTQGRLKHRPAALQALVHIE